MFRSNCSNIRRRSKTPFNSTHFSSVSQHFRFPCLFFILLDTVVQIWTKLQIDSNHFLDQSVYLNYRMKYASIILMIGYKYGIVYIDVRGSGGRGWKYRSPIYRRLITVEVEDTLEAIKYQFQPFNRMLNISLRMVLAKYPRFDKNRLGVFGWSYGGTLAIRLVQVCGK